VIDPGGSEPWRVGLALVLLIVIAWVPGLAAHRRLLPGRSRLEALACAPALSAGLLYPFGELATVTGLPVDGRIALGIAGLGLMALLPELRRMSAPTAKLPVAAVGAAVALSTLVWSLGIRHLTAVTPHDDGYNHGYFVRRISETSTLDPLTVMRRDVLLGGHGADYYPFALHQQAASLVQLLHLDVAVAWTLTSLLLVIVALPLGCLALGRKLFPEDRVIAPACALVAAAAPGVTYSTAWWGGYALAAGFAVAGGALLLAWQASERFAAAPTVAAALGLAGVAGIHTSEYSLITAVVAGVIVTTGLLRRSAGWMLSSLFRLALVLAGSLVLLAPAVLQMHRGLEERSSYPVPQHGVPLGRAVSEVLSMHAFVPPATPTALVLALWAGLLACVLGRRALPWVACWVTFAVLYVWLAAYPSGFVAGLTATWYSDRFRLGYILAFLAIPIVAAALTAGGRRARRELRIGGAMLGVVLVVTSTAASIDAVRDNYEDFSLIREPERAAFRYLRDHVSADEHVLNQHQDGSPWMYSLYGVAPVVALKTDFDRPEWRDARYLAAHVHDAGVDPEVDRLLAVLNVRFVYVGPRVFPTTEPELVAARLAGSPALHLVFEQDGAKIYEVVG